MRCLPVQALRSRSKQVTERDVDGRLAVVGGQATEGTGDVEDEPRALQAETEGSAGISTPVVPDVASPQVHFALVHHIGAEADCFSPERARIHEASGGPKLRVFHVMVNELEPVARAKLDLGGEWIPSICLSRVEPAPEIPY